MKYEHPGQPRIYKTDDEIWTAALKYFEWTENNPLIEIDFMNSKEGIQRVEKPKMRAMTIQALCIHLNISDETWMNYRKKPEYIGICTRVEKIIYDQKLTGAAAGFLKENIICRELFPYIIR